MALAGLWSAPILAARHGMQAFESVRAAPEGWKVEGAPSAAARLEFRISLFPVSAEPAAEAFYFYRMEDHWDLQLISLPTVLRVENTSRNRVSQFRIEIDKFPASCSPRSAINLAISILNRR